MAAQGRPTSADALVAQLRAGVAALRAHIEPPSSMLHVLSEPVAQHLGLYPAQQQPTLALSPEAWADAFDVLHTAVRRVRENIGDADKLLISELGAQASETVRAARGIEATALLGDDPSAVHALPEALYRGALRGETCTTRETSLALIEALCTAITPVATQLRLESFQERVEAADADTSMPDALERTHTFTSGGRIIVLDVEFALETHTWVPNVKLNISYAHAEDTQTGPDAESDPRLPTLIGSILQQLAHVLHHGTCDTHIFSACPHPASPTPYAYALCLWQAFVQHLATLAYMDALSAHAVRRVEGSPRVDLFAVLESLGKIAEAVCHQQAAELLGRPITSLADVENTLPDLAQQLTRRAHGLALQHVASPYLTLVYALPAPHAVQPDTRHTATVRIAPCAVPLSAPSAPVVSHDARLDDVHAHGTVVSEAPLWTPRSEEPRPMQRPIAYVARLDPPVPVPYHVACAVWAACQLAPPPWSERHPTGPGPRRDFAAHLLPQASYTAAPGCDRSEVCMLSTLPFTSLAQVYDALALVRDHARLGELLRNAPMMPRIPVTVAVRPHGKSSCLRLSFSVPSRGAMANVRVQPCTTHPSGWAVEAYVTQLRGTADDAAAHTAAGASTAAWADVLADTAALDTLVKHAQAWAEQVLDSS